MEGTPVSHGGKLGTFALCHDLLWFPEPWPPKISTLCPLEPAHVTWFGKRDLQVQLSQGLCDGELLLLTRAGRC